MLNIVVDSNINQHHFVNKQEEVTNKKTKKQKNKKNPTREIGCGEERKAKERNIIIVTKQ